MNKKVSVYAMNRTTRTIHLKRNVRLSFLKKITDEIERRRM